MSASLIPILLKFTPDGDLYDAARNRLVSHLEPGEMISINAGSGEYTIIVHRSMGKRPAKIMRLVKKQEQMK